VVEALPNHAYCVETSEQISVQSEQRLKPYHVSPDTVGQAPPSWSLPVKPITRGRVTQPREWEIFVPRTTESDAELELPSQSTIRISYPPVQAQRPRKWRTSPPLLWWVRGHTTCKIYRAAISAGASHPQKKSED